MYDVVTLGAATLDISMQSSQFQLVEKNGSVALCEKFDDKIDVEHASVSTGGAATNTAVGFARMGFKVACISEVGTDFAGDMILRDLQEESVDTTLLISERSEQTATSVLLISQDGGRTALVFRGASRMITPDDIDWNALETKWIHLSSVGNTELVQKVFSFCKERHIKLSWNPGNWEIEKIKNNELAIDWQTLELLCVNREEMSQLSGVDLRSEEQWKSEWCFRGPKISIATDGKKGGRYCVDGSCHFYEVGQVDTVQETGAGDAFISGFISGQLMNMTVEDSISLAKKNSASVVQHMGAKTGLLRKQP